MKNTDNNILNALRSLSSDHRFIQVMRWMSENLNEEDKKNRVIPEVNELLRGQGRAQILHAILSTIEDARNKTA